MAVRLPTCASVHVNPTQAEMRALVLGEMPRITETEFGNLSYEAEVTARLKNSTFFVTDTENHQNRMSSIHAARWAELQDEYIADKDMILADWVHRPRCWLSDWMRALHRELERQHSGHAAAVVLSCRRQLGT